MASSSVATPRRHVSTKKSTKKPNVVSISKDAAALERMVISRGPNAKARAEGTGSIAGAIGPKANAIASGIDGIAVAGGEGAHAGLDKVNGESTEAVAAAAGVNCLAQCRAGSAYADIVAIGTGATAISECKEVAAVAIGHAAFAIAPQEGIAISIGFEAAAMAGYDGWLIFIDPGSKGRPAVRIVKAALFEDGAVHPDVPYWWKAGMDMPEIDTERLELKPIG